MRKITLLMILALSSWLVSAQGISLGLKGGLNFPSIDAVGVGNGVSASNIENSTGYHVGPYLKLKVSKIAVQTEILYSFQETNFDLVAGTSTYDVTQRLGYLTVPVMLRLYTVAGINLQAGPQFGFLISGKQEDNVLGARTTTDMKNSMKESDIGLNLGLGIDLPFNLDVHARYIIGITDVNDVSGGESTKNSQFQISIGYSFVNLGR